MKKYPKNFLTSNIVHIMLNTKESNFVKMSKLNFFKGASLMILHL